jgi:hypothetical protein
MSRQLLLVSYNSDQDHSMVKPEKSNIMKRRLEKTESLTDHNHQSLAAFIMAHKEKISRRTSKCDA